MGVHIGAHRHVNCSDQANALQRTFHEIASQIYFPKF